MNDWLQQLGRDLKEKSIEFGMRPEVAGDFAKSMIDTLQHNYPGSNYIAKPKNARRERIKKMFNGVNHTEVCGEFGISKSTLYRILKE